VLKVKLIQQTDVLTYEVDYSNEGLVIAMSKVPRQHLTREPSSITDAKSSAVRHPRNHSCEIFM
jgi:hypothetical protein